MAQEATKKVDWKKWLGRVQARHKVFENGWYKQAKEAEKMYDCAKEDGQSEDTNPFNILYANTEVLLPSLYSSSPRPEVTSRYIDGPTEVAQACEAFLTSIIDSNSPGKETFDDGCEQATLAALVPGCGHVRVKVYPDEPCPLRVEGGSYDELIWGYAKKWAKVPWIAFVHKMTKEDIKKKFNLSDEQAKLLSVPSQEEEDEKKEKNEPHPTYVYELWIKESKQTVFLCEGYKETLLGEPIGDVLKLSGFYPTPGPLTLVRKPSGLDPTPLYQYYRNQATELNRVTVRLNKILSALRVRGVYNALIGKDMENVLSDENMENGLSPSQNPIDMQGGGFDKNIWLMPVDKLILVARELYSARQAILSVIQQITGLADIVRGASVASETATAQELKNKWGTIRLRRMQRIVSLYVRDTLRLLVDAGAEVLDVETWKAMTQLPYPTDAEKQQAQMQLQQLAQQAAMQPQMPGQPPAPPPEPPPELLKVVQTPSWEDILTQLKNDQGRVYTIDIETSSTLDMETTGEKEEIQEFMMAMGQLMSGLEPLVALGPSGGEVAKEILLAITSKYSLGRDLRSSLKKLAVQPPNPEEADPSIKAEQENKMQKLQLDKEIMQQEHAFKLEKMDLDRQQMQAQAKQAEFKMGMEVEQAQQAAKVKETTAAIGLQSQAQGAQAKQQQSQIKTAQAGQAAAQAGAPKADPAIKQVTQKVASLENQLGMLVSAVNELAQAVVQGQDASRLDALAASISEVSKRVEAIQTKPKGRVRITPRPDGSYDASRDD